MNKEHKKDDTFNIFATNLLQKRKLHSINSSLKTASIEFIKEIITFLFPHFSTEPLYDTNDVVLKLRLLKKDLITLLMMRNGSSSNENMTGIVEDFIEEIPAINDMLWNDANEIYKGDPAAESIDEVILAYPGFTAIAIYRFAHKLYELNVPIIPRILTEYAHELTGIDIHPGAKIGSPFFIDHGTGVVIGETTEIGKNVKIYQGVTLGALSVEKSMSKSKRHPTIQDNVIIYSQAVILGGDTVIGNNSIIGGNAWITQSIPANSFVSSKMEVRVRSNQQYFDTMEFII